MKNRDKYMKQIYAMIPNSILVDFIGVDKKTNKPFVCTDESHEIKDCYRCKFSKTSATDEWCDCKKIIKWLNQED